MTVPTHNTRNGQELYWWLFSRATLTFPFEHPLELIKNSSQANPTLSSREVIKEIYKTQGMKGFANTASITYPKRLLRESSRLCIISCSQNLLAERFPGIFKKNDISIKLTTAAISTIFNAAFIVPLEQLISYRIKEKKTYREFFRSRFAQDGISSLYSGWRVDFINQLSLWTLLMAIDHYSKGIFNRYDPEQKHPYLKQGITSVAIAGTLIASILPINFVKVRIQMDKELQKEHIRRIPKRLYRQFGLRGFYSGAAPVFIHSVLHATFYGKIFDYIYTDPNTT